MATLPAEINQSRLPVEANAPLGRSGGFLTGEFVSGFGALPMVRQVGLLVGIAASIALGVAAVLWLQEPDYKPLTGGWATYDAKQVSEVLQAKSIKFRIEPESGMLLVDASRLVDARMALAGEELLGSATGAAKSADAEMPFGSSQQAETNRFLHTLESELAATIATVNSVKSARVHIAMPRATAFVRDQRKPSASVALVLQPGRTLERPQVRAVMNLVARAVPELKPEEVTIVDQQGELLSGQEDDQIGEATDRQYKYTRKLESDLARKVQDILIPTVGDGRFRVQVSAEVDFTWQEETAEQFNPDLPAIRSEQTVEEQRAGNAPESGVPGALSNTPPAPTTTPESLAAGAANLAPVAGGTAPNAASASSPGNSRRESTRNYELDRKYSHVQRPLGQVRRLSVSVLVDDVPTNPPPLAAPAAAVDGATTPKAATVAFEPWTDAELERLSIMVKNAIGYDAARGDVVSVLNAPFIELPEEVAQSPPFWTQPWFQDALKMLLIAGVVMSVVFGVLRPAFRMVTRVGNDVEASALAPPPPNPLITDEQLDDTLDDVVALSPSAQSVLASSAGYGPQLDAVRGLIAADPARVAAVVKSWVAIEE